ncbi:MAG: S-methyl-5-thioribose-1-phosphate isomerase [Blastocatellia bacterium]|nr:S-methyl-5-thioribose-1-phosphate isomerase [Blastocatellia bacterium]MCS7158322.1 S-methyl-5-thioribose-1-phosphate isomerase [Blastocatellia bacterium]MCX7753160.1 S-methyl-5-thioribose-1-phosphate isomerase [Blastocatellia bacterium]MDW8169475.1 S-methyl-5-thioribose-1-phosphate isomerase [Acidobacteriota bacterium]MDW8255749.1 S-methyl-5-thioribose-1-phosphate isomerase [Acidobacteriota bacterium]
MIKTVEWTDEGIRVIDQRKLPHEEVYPLLRTPEEVAEAIRAMVVRGAPAIGVTAAFGLALGVKRSSAHTVEELEAEFEALCQLMARARPTAVNLFWAIERMRRALAEARRHHLSLPALKEWMVREAQNIYREDIETNWRMARHGAALIPDPARILTHCNTGALATAGGMGTALGVVRAAVLMGKRVHVYVDETRPFLQGARLTAWELLKEQIPATLITDNMAGYMMYRGLVDCVLVGADRIAANGDVANKIGTYTLAVLAKEHNIPFYVVAPISTLDLSIASGDQIPIEERPASEVTHINGHPIAPEGIAVANPAFDITPHRYVTAIVTERGIARPPYPESLSVLAAQPDVTQTPAEERAFSSPAPSSGLS